MPRARNKDDFLKSAAEKYALLLELIAKMSATASHYDWAIKKIKAHCKKVR